MTIQKPSREGLSEPSLEMGSRIESLVPEYHDQPSRLRGKGRGGREENTERLLLEVWLRRDEGRLVSWKAGRAKQECLFCFFLLKCFTLENFKCK